MSAFNLGENSFILYSRDDVSQQPVENMVLQYKFISMVEYGFNLTSEESKCFPLRLHNHS